MLDLPVFTIFRVYYSRHLYMRHMDSARPTCIIFFVNSNNYCYVKMSYEITRGKKKQTSARLRVALGIVFFYSADHHRFRGHSTGNNIIIIDKLDFLYCFSWSIAILCVHSVIHNIDYVITQRIHYGAQNVFRSNIVILCI